MSNETWHNCSANVIFGLIPFAYLAGHQSPKVRIKVTAKIMQQETTLVLIWRPILIPDHRIVRIVWKLGFKWCSQPNKFQISICRPNSLSPPFLLLYFKQQIVCKY